MDLDDIYLEVEKMDVEDIISLMGFCETQIDLRRKEENDETKIN